MSKVKKTYSGAITGFELTFGQWFVKRLKQFALKVLKNP